VQHTRAPDRGADAPAVKEGVAGGRRGNRPRAATAGLAGASRVDSRGRLGVPGRVFGWDWACALVGSVGCTGGLGRVLWRARAGAWAGNRLNESPIPLHSDACSREHNQKREGFD